MFILKAFFVLKILILYSNSFGYVEIRLDKRAEVNFKVYDVTNWERNNYNKHYQISQKVKAATIPHINSETNPPPPIINVVCKYLRQCRYSANILQHWVGGRGLIYFCKVDHSRIFINFSRNWLGLNNLCEILQTT